MATLKQTLAELKALGDEKIRAQNKKRGAGDNQYGVKLGDLRKLAAKIKTNHDLALELWRGWGRHATLAPTSAAVAWRRRRCWMLPGAAPTTATHAAC